MEMNKPSSPSNQTVALCCILVASVLGSGMFVLARNDSDMKLLALGCLISLVSSFSATASTMLVGKSFESHPSVTNAPLGSTVQEISATTVTPQKEIQ